MSSFPPGGYVHLSQPMCFLRMQHLKNPPEDVQCWANFHPFITLQSLAHFVASIYFVTFRYKYNTQWYIIDKSAAAQRQQRLLCTSGLSWGIFSLFLLENLVENIYWMNLSFRNCSLNLTILQIVVETSLGISSLKISSYLPFTIILVFTTGHWKAKFCES